MRYRIACLVSSWLIGVGIGAFTAPYFFIISCIAALAVFLWFLRPGKQVFIACLLVLPLGYVHGAHTSSLNAGTCAAQSDSVSHLERTYSFSASYARYVFKRNDGCSLLVYAPRYPVLTRGAQARIVGLQEPVLAAFSYLPEYAHALQDDDIFLVVRNARLEDIQDGRYLFDRARLAAMSSLTTLFREPDSSLFVAMLAGDQGMVPSALKDAYRRSGIIHILSISGLHISLLALVTTFLVRSLPLRPSVQSGIIILCLWGYIAAVGFPESAVRAGVFWTLYAAAYRARALIGVPTVILLTLAVLITLQPSIVKSIGFELSVAAVSGIAIALFFQKKIAQPRRWKALAQLLAVSVGATIATAPLTLYYFGNLSFLGLVANLFVVPLMPVVMYLALLALVLFPVAPPLALIVAYPAHLLMRWIVFIAVSLSRVPYGYIEQVEFPLWAVGMTYAFLFCGIVILMKRLRIPARQIWI